MEDANLRAVRPGDTSLQTEKVSLALGRAMPDVASGIQKFRDMEEDNRFRRLQGCEVGVNL